MEKNVSGFVQEDLQPTADAIESRRFVLTLILD